MNPTPLLAAVLLLAGCGSATPAPSAPAATSSATPTPDATESTISDADIATDQAACRSLLIVADPATQLSPLLGVTETIRLSRLVGQAGVTSALAALDVPVANPILARPVDDLRAQVQLVQQSIQYKTSVAPEVNYATAQEDERQIRVLCGQIGVVPA